MCARTHIMSVKLEVPYYANGGGSGARLRDSFHGFTLVSIRQWSGANPEFLNRGGAKDYGVHQDHETRSPLQQGFRALETLGF